MQQISYTEIMEFIYDSEEEKLEHKKSIENMGYEDSGQIKIDLNRSFQNPDYHWYGKYFKYHSPLVKE